jgi:predicted RNA-binding Zn-ribbon protein involved in translation (DUF1610 family)
LLFHDLIIPFQNKKINLIFSVVDDKKNINKNNSLSKICPNCHVALLRPHPHGELAPKWQKCPVCGYTEPVIKKGKT